MIHQYPRTMRVVLSTVLGLLAAAPATAHSPQGQPIPAPNQAQQDQDLEVQTRGPVHEAFADLVTFDPTPGVEIAREPPAAIEEIPPDQRPEGNLALWINGYWSWDEDRNDFLWVSGVWRVPPPDHAWTPGYWHRGGTGWGWVQGFWLPNQGQAAAEVTYLSAPPENLEAGPSSPQPSQEHLWAPGVWTWVDDRYAWRPGYWMVANPDWVWTSACYRWTPGGHVFIEGHWDHLLGHRGVLFAPVVFHRRQAMYTEYHYSPSIGIDLGILSLHLFSRPQYNHYYFGDWYAPTYWDRGIYPTFAFHMSSFGYDPIYQHSRWEHRANEVQWEASIHSDFHRYRDDEHLRPQHTFAAQQAFVASRGPDRRDEIVMARPIRELPAQRGSNLRLEAVPADDRRRITEVNQEQFRATAERGKIESTVATRRPTVKDHVAAPEKVTLPRAQVIAHAEAKARPPASPVRTQQPTAAREPKGEQPVGTGKPTAPPARKPDGAPGEREGNTGQPGIPSREPLAPPVVKP